MYLTGVLVSVLAVLLLTIFLVIIAISDSLEKSTFFIVVFGMYIFVLAFGIACAIMGFRNQFGVTISDEGVTITSRTSTGVIGWEQIAEVHRDKSFFGPFQPSTKAGKRKRQSISWKDKTTGVRLSLIAQDGDDLACIHSSSYKEFEKIANLIETKTSQIQRRSTRDMENERTRALRSFRRRATKHIVLDLIVLSACLGYFEFDRKAEAKNMRLSEIGHITNATVLKSETLGDETVLVKYEFVGQQDQSFTATKRIKRKAWETRESHQASIEIVFDPTDPTHNKPTRVPLDPVLLNKPMRIIFYYVLPAIFLASLLLNIYQFFTRNYHYETGRYTTVKLGKPKNAATM
ncbi:MAG TPA: hypothetical protein EYO33_31575 [Phycisphaerales bacterium]|nr:hypothetical protein [Phycisphaerales bacterium]|tara:strand:+ start:1637 stop:2680 length:1044 start_codon:yes stop_codon:yes gene_type:complete